MSEDRLLCGFKVRSELQLSDLPIWVGDDRPPDLTITLGAVSSWSEDKAIWHKQMQVDREGRCRFHVPQVATYCIDAAGRNIAIDLAGDAVTSVVQDFLFGSVLVVLCQRRNLWPLHASCVRVGDKAVAFTGPSGAGKSTLAAAFMAQGYDILSDDVTVLDFSSDKHAMVLPSVPRVKLWGNTVPDIGLSITHTQTENSLCKERLPMGDSFSSKSLPLASIYYFEPLLNDSTVRIQSLYGMGAVNEICKATHRIRLMIDLIGCRKLFLESAMRVAAGIAAHRRLERYFGLATLPDLVEIIVANENAHSA